MKSKRVTIYDLAREINVSVSYISKALNDHPSVSAKFKELVKNKAAELNYRNNWYAANLRQGISRTIGVVVPHINQRIFSEAIAGIEEVCFENKYGLIICQSHESYAKECKAIDTLIHQNVDCVLISVSSETHSTDHLQNIINNNIELVQFDRYIDGVDTFKVINNNEEITCKMLDHLITQGFKRIAFVNGPEYSAIFELRKQGYLKTMRAAGLAVPENFIFKSAYSQEPTFAIASKLLRLDEPPDAFVTVSDHQALGVLQAANSLGINVPKQLGIIGFANEDFTGIVTPSLSSVNQKSKELGKRAANLFFERLEKGNNDSSMIIKEEVIEAELIIRASSTRNSLYE
jgi:DNA-binding LacI/PurR family transcriptional regulator